MNRRSVLVLVLGLFAFGLVAVAAEAGPEMMKVMKEYRTAIMKVKRDPVQAIPVHLEYAVKATEAAQAENNANYMGFTGGPEKVQYLTEARAALDQLTKERGESDADVVRLTGMFDETWIKVAAMCSAFGNAKLENERAPEDVYTGSDRKQIESMILEQWKKTYPDDEILDIRFHMSEWERKTGRNWHDVDQAWYNFDKSVIAVSMIVKTSDTVATVYPAYANKDNLSNGKITIGVDTKGSGYVHREVLLKNLEMAD